MAMEQPRPELTTLARLDHWRNALLAQEREGEVLRITPGGTEVKKCVNISGHTFYQVNNSGFINVSSIHHLEETIDCVEEWAAQWTLLKITEGLKYKE